MSRLLVTGLVTVGLLAVLPLDGHAVSAVACDVNLVTNGQPDPHQIAFGPLFSDPTRPGALWFTAFGYQTSSGEPASGSGYILPGQGPYVAFSRRQGSFFRQYSLRFGLSGPPFTGNGSVLDIGGLGVFEALSAGTLENCRLAPDP